MKINEGYHTVGQAQRFNVGKNSRKNSRIKANYSLHFCQPVVAGTRAPHCQNIPCRLLKLFSLISIVSCNLDYIVVRLI